MPQYVITKKVGEFYIVLAPEYPNWIILDFHEYGFFEHLKHNSIKESMIKQRDSNNYNELEVIAIAERVLTKIEFADFYCETEIRDELKIKDITKTIHINLTNDCNLRCKHCYMSAGFNMKTELDKEKLVNFIEEFSRLNGKTDVVLSGGEPLMYSSLCNVIINLKRLGHKIILFTNGILINESNIAFLKENVDEIQISMEGITRQYYESVRGLGTYDSLIRALKLVQEKHIPLTLAVTVLDDVLEDISLNLLPFLKEMNFNDIEVRINDSIENKGNFLLFNSSQEIDKETKKIKVIKIINQLVNNGYTSRNSKERNIHFSNCGIGTTININYDSKIYPCSEYGRLFFDLDTNPDYIISSFNEISNNSSLMLMSECSDCDLKFICGGSCRVKNQMSNGSYIKPICNEELKNMKLNELLIDYLNGYHND